MPEGSEETLEADVCIVGSGSGGSVIAAILAQRGLEVVVLEAAGYFNESDFNQLELPAYQEMYWRGGTAADGRRQRQPRRRHHARRRHHDQLDELPAHPRLGPRAVGGEHGLEGVDGPDFDRHLDAVWSGSAPTTSAATSTGRSSG